MLSTDRGTGRTTRQMQEAPHGAVFIWYNEHLFYPKNLARHLGRSDLVIISPNQVDHCLRGRKTVVVDHAAPGNFPKRQWDYLCAYLEHRP